MSRITRLKAALPILGLAACAAFSSAVPSAFAAGERAVVHSGQDAGERKDSYALVRQGESGSSMHTHSGDRKSIEAVRRSIDGDFLWFRDGGKAYVVQDREVLAKVDAAWAPLNRLGERMDGYGRQMDEHGKRMAALGKQMDEAAASLVRGRETDRKTQGAEASMEEIGKRMNEAGKPMDALGKQMNLLGKQMERESRTADKAVRALIREAMAKGLASPAPAQG